MGDDTAEAGVGQGRAGPVAGKHVMDAAFMGGFAMGHAPDEDQFVRDLGGIFPELTDLDAIHIGIDGTERATVFRGGKGLGIPAFLVGHPPRQEDVDDALRLAFDGGILLDLCPGLHLEIIRQGKAEGAANADMHESASGQAAGIRRGSGKGHGGGGWFYGN